MKIKVKGIVPISTEFCPKFEQVYEEVYNVLRLFENSRGEKVFYIMVNGTIVGVSEKHCKVL